jgi:hypothetical protein
MDDSQPRKKNPQTLISTGGVSIALQLTRSCSFSMKTNVKIVCGLWGRKGAVSLDGEESSKSTQVGDNTMEKTGGGSVTHVRRNQAGVQPFIRNRGPSLRRPWVVIWRRLCFVCHTSFSQIFCSHHHGQRPGGERRLGKERLKVRKSSW